MAAYRWLLSEGVSPQRIVIGGDSCGGGLTIATLVALKYFGDPLPAGGISHSGWTDLAHTGDSFVANAEADPLIDKDMLEGMAAAYLGDRSRTTPLASPYYADLRGLPPLLLQVGTAEVLLDDSLRLADRAKEEGVDVTLEVWDDMPHVWQAFASFLPKPEKPLNTAESSSRITQAEPVPADLADRLNGGPTWVAHSSTAWWPSTSTSAGPRRPV